jgi:hypothetical protein
MKKKNNSILILMLLALVSIAPFISCSKDELPNDGNPRILYVRDTDPAISDSLIAGAYQGQLIAIMGENLQDVKEIYFNDQKATFISTYVTSNSILVSVPSNVPKEVDNKLKLVFSSSNTLEYDFKVLINEPVITNMRCEFVPDGGVATIIGNYFYAPLTVTFTGGVTGTIKSVEDNTIKVTVPAGAEPGPITISTNFGVAQSDFWFRDNRNIFISSDPWSGWWGQDYVVTNPGSKDPIAINGNYIRITKTISDWAWSEVAGGPPSDMGAISKNIPEEAIRKPSLYNFKFEVNTIKPYSSNVIKFNVGLTAWNNDAYKWNPPYDTKGEWQTVTIPFDEMVTAYGAPLTVNADGYYSRVLFHGAGALDCDMCFDNFRVVPKDITK